MYREACVGNDAVEVVGGVTWLELGDEFGGQGVGG